MISIIIPVYNTSEYIENCLNSVLNNNRLNYEIILINDGSTDKSAGICEKYAKMYPHRISYIEQTNHGVSFARNVGIKHAKGDWLLFIDSDDQIISKNLYEPDINDDIELFIYNYCHSDEKVKSVKNREPYIEEIKDISLYYEKILFPNSNNGLLYKSYHTPWPKLYRTSIVKSKKIFFPLDLPIGEDMIFNIEYMSYVNKVCYMNEMLYVVTNRESSASRKKLDNKRQIENDVKFNKSLFECFNKINIINNYHYLYSDKVIDNCIRDYLLTGSLIVDRSVLLQEMEYCKDISIGKKICCFVLGHNLNFLKLLIKVCYNFKKRIYS